MKKFYFLFEVKVHAEIYNSLLDKIQSSFFCLIELVYIYQGPFNYVLGLF